MVYDLQRFRDLRKAARMNMVMNGDGHGHIFNFNSIEYGVYGTKEAAFEAAMVAASFAIRSGDGVQINAPSDANMRATEKPDPWPKEWIGYLK